MTARVCVAWRRKLPFFVGVVSSIPLSLPVFLFPLSRARPGWSNRQALVGMVARVGLLLALLLPGSWCQPVLAQRKPPASGLGPMPHSGGAKPPEGGKKKYANAPGKALKAFESAEKLIDKREFDKAIGELEDLNRKYPSFAQPWLRKASVLASMGRKRESYESYKKGFANLPYDALYASDYSSGGDLALSFGDYALARQLYEALLKANPRNKRGLPQAQRGLQTIAFAEQQLANPATDLNPEPLPDAVNPFRFHYFPAITADGRALVFTARKGPAALDDEDIYIARRVNAGGGFGKPRSISAHINTRLNEGAASISGDGRTLVFTACNRPEGRGDCDLYYSRREAGEWSAPVNLGPTVNSNAWDSQPSLSADGRTLYFSSNRAGGLGSYDIYVTTLREDAIWAPAQNLGAPINSVGQDLAPFLHASGTTLYFASDGPVGMGGLDLFRAGRRGKGWDAPQNLGYPLNTFEDEGSLFVTTDNHTGYYSRGLNRDTKDFTIRLFQFAVPPSARSFEQSAVAQGRVFDADTKKTLGATVQLYDIGTDELVESVQSDKADGEYTVVLTEGHQYAMYATADGYLIKSLTFDYQGRKEFDPLTLDIYLSPVKAGASLVLNNLFFRTNSYELEKKSKTELNRLTAYLNQYPTLTVEVSGHTDNVGTPPVNLTLSENRARAVVDYLVKNGVKAERLKFRGYGDTQPAAANNSEANRQFNRRIELRVL